MATFNFVCALVVATCFNFVLTAEDIAEDHQEQSSIKRVVGRAYSLTSCDYRTQIGYTCLTCNRALHCYPGNVALLVDCYGIFRFCRDGRCSRHQGEKCFSDNKLSTPSPVFNTTIPVTGITANSDTNGNFVTTNTGTANSDPTNVGTINADITNVGTTNADARNVGNTKAATTRVVAENVTEVVTEAVSLLIDTKATTKGDVNSKARRPR